MNKWIHKAIFLTAPGIGVLLMIPAIRTCERFTPARDIYLYTDTVTVQSGGTYILSAAILNIGRNEITQHGFCWSEDNDPIPEQDSSSNQGEKHGPGTFSYTLNGLSASTTYYFRAYATNAAGTELGNVKQFTTPAHRIPTVTTAAVSYTSGDSALCGGTITDDGGALITARGVCWATSAGPSLSDFFTEDGSGTGSFTSTLTELSPGTFYYVRAYATNAAGTAFGDDMSFTTAEVPSVTTGSVTGVTAHSAEAGGTVVSDGGDSVIARGVCWGPSPGPSLSDFFTEDGSGTGSFTSTLTELSPGTFYYVRAYATNSAGTAFGDEVNFTTLDVPAVNTGTIDGITVSSAEGGGEVVSDGGDSVIARGICWDTSPGPSVSDDTTYNGAGTGIFTSSMTGLSLFTRYYVRAYAENSVGITYGEEVTFRTSWDNSTVTDIDGNEYNTVGIGDQVWMARNLSVTHYSDGTAIPLVESAAEWSAMDFTDSAYCWYDNNIGNINSFGGLYTWATATRGDSSRLNPSGLQGACPDGWHLPSDDEWKELEMALGMSQADTELTGFRGNNEGDKLKITGTTYWTGPNDGATNEFGFSGLGSGIRDFNGDFNFIGWVLPMWSSTYYDTSGAWIRALQYDEARISRNPYTKSNGYAIRCVKDL